MKKNKKEARKRYDATVELGERIFSRALTAAVIAVVIMVNVLVYMLNAYTNALYITPSEKEIPPISGATDSLFEEAFVKGAKVEISFCLAEDDLKPHDTGSLVYKTAKEYEARYPELISLNYINVITQRDKDGHSVAEDFKKYTDAGITINSTSVIFECEDRYRVLTDDRSGTGFIDFYTINSSGSILAYDGELVMAGMIAGVIRTEYKKAYLTIGHTEQVDPSFARLVELAGYRYDTVDLSDVPVPDDCDLLIISAPRNDFDSSGADSSINHALTEIGRLEAYLRSGGSLYVALDPYVKSLPNLEGLLSSLGIALADTEIDGNVIRDIVRDYGHSVTNDGYAIITEHADGELATRIGETVSRYTDGDVITRYAGALELSGSAEALLVSSSGAICEDSGFVTDREGSYPIAAYNRLTLTGGEREATVYVHSSIYLTVSSALVTNGYSNRDYTLAVFDELFGQDNLPYGCATVLTDDQTLENLTMNTATLYTVLMLALPVGLLGYGTVTIVRRKNR